MARPHSLKFTLAALLLLAVTVAILASLGRWQLHRADERRVILAAIEAGRAQPPLELTAVVSGDQLRPWRRASAKGQWLTDKSVLLDNRNHDGRPGYWLATPLQIDETHAVLVLRGWLPRAIPGHTALPLPPTPSGAQTVVGELATHVPRLFELWSLGASENGQLPHALPMPDGVPPNVQNLELDAYARATGLTLLPTVLTQTQGDGDNLVRDWPQPSVDSNKNLGYAMQWFAFAAIAGIAWLVVLCGAIARARRRKQ